MRNFLTLVFVKVRFSVAAAAACLVFAFAQYASCGSTWDDTASQMNGGACPRGGCISSGGSSSGGSSSGGSSQWPSKPHYRPGGGYGGQGQQFDLFEKDCQHKIASYVSVCMNPKIGVNSCTSRIESKYFSCFSRRNQRKLEDMIASIYKSYAAQSEELSQVLETEPPHAMLSGGTTVQKDKVGLGITQQGSNIATREGSRFEPDKEVDAISKKIRTGAYGNVTLESFLTDLDGRDDLTWEQKGRLHSIAENNKGMFLNSLTTDKVTADTANLHDAARTGKAENLLAFNGGALSNAAKMSKGASGAKQKTEQELAEARARSDKYLMSARQALTRGDYNAAYDAAKKATEENEFNSDAFALMALISARRGSMVSAYAESSRAIELNKRNADAYGLRGELELRDNKFTEGYMDEDAAAKIDPNTARYFYLRGLAAYGMKNYRQYKADIEAALQKDPNNADYKAAFDKLMQQYHLSPEAFGEPAVAAQQQAKKPLTKEEAVSESGKRLQMAFALLLVLAAGAGVAIMLARRKESSEKEVLRTMGIPTGTAPAQARTTAKTAAPAAGQTAATANTIGGQFTVKRELGRGGMGVVYEAEDITLGRRVAVKEMLGSYENEDSKRRFLNEAKTVASLAHPNICSIYTVVAEGDKVYLVFEYVDGRPLDMLIKSSGRIPVDQAKPLFLGVCDALICAHSRNIIHRDMKPSNIMVTSAGTAKVMDFGIARQADSEATMMTQSISGTPAYMAPEQMSGTLTRKSDIYALGATLYQTLTGTLPFRCAPTDPARKTYIPARTHTPGISPAMDALLEKSLKFAPEERFHTVEEFKAALNAAS